MTTTTDTRPTVWECPKCGTWFAAYVPVLDATHRCPQDRPGARRRHLRTKEATR